MKRLLIGYLLTISFMSSAAILGVPSEDPVVKNVRSRFETGRTPEETDLLGKEFTCTSMLARKGDFEKWEWNHKLTFSKFDGFFVSHAGEENSLNKLYYISNQFELIGSFEGPRYMAFRIDSKGYLVGEISTANVPNVYRDITILDSVATSLPMGTKVIVYLLCIQK